MEQAEIVTWRMLVFSRPDSGLAPFAVWEVTRDGMTAAGADPRQARARLAVARKEAGEG